MKFKENENVKIDTSHAELVYGLIVSAKPMKILELGLGGGKSADSIIKGIEYNENNPEFTIVDNWLDFDFQMPKEVHEQYSQFANIITSDEKDFVFSCKEKFNFIFSDADHYNTDQWFEYVFNNLLEEGGILIYHDVNLFEDSFSNLRNIYFKTLENKYNHFLFNKNSKIDERCHRGLLVIFKN
jgi:predicted O-methyltransferase YrrM